MFTNKMGWLWVFFFLFLKLTCVVHYFIYIWSIFINCLTYIWVSFNTYLPYIYFNIFPIIFWKLCLLSIYITIIERIIIPEWVLLLLASNLKRLRASNWAGKSVHYILYALRLRVHLPVCFQLFNVNCSGKGDFIRT